MPTKPVFATTDVNSTYQIRLDTASTEMLEDVAVKPYLQPLVTKAFSAYKAAKIQLNQPAQTEQANQTSFEDTFDVTKTEQLTQEESTVIRQDLTVDFTKLDQILKIHEDSLTQHIRSKLNLEEERELNRRLLLELKQRDQEKLLLKKIMEH